MRFMTPRVEPGVPLRVILDAQLQSLAAGLIACN
jgi:hypothetical protein